MGAPRPTRRLTRYICHGHGSSLPPIQSSTRFVIRPVIVAKLVATKPGAEQHNTTLGIHIIRAAWGAAAAHMAGYSAQLPRNTSTQIIGQRDRTRLARNVCECVSLMSSAFAFGYPSRWPRQSVYILYVAYKLQHCNVNKLSKAHLSLDRTIARTTALNRVIIEESLRL